MAKIHKQPLVVGLTGGIGAGKSTIVNMLKDMEIPVFDCDAYVHELYRRPDNVAHLTELYGDLGIHPRLTLSRMAWAEGNREVRKYLENFFLPQVTLGLLTFIDSHVAKERKVIVVDAPTLFEAKLQDMMDWVVVVDAPKDERFIRVMNRPEMNAEKFHAVCRAQIDDQTRRHLADSIIFNDGAIEDAQDQTKTLFAKLQRIANA